MESIFEQMVARYPHGTAEARHNATCEVLQQVVLAGLYRAGFFEHAAFYGGTCLRILHGLNRFSEDLDFSLLRKDADFSLEEYFPAIIDECRLLGREVEIKRKDKKTFGKVESAFLKDNTDVYNLTFQTERSIRVKIEVDTMPPLLFNTDERLLMQPFSFMVRCFTLPCLFAGKVHALLFRKWGSRVKGRDWYDFEWYVRNGIPLDLSHLRKRSEEFNGVALERDEMLIMLENLFASADMRQVKSDVLPFAADPGALDIWSNDYFLKLIPLLKIL